MNNSVHGFWNSAEARKRSPVVSRPDLVDEYNARGEPPPRGDGGIPSLFSYRLGREDARAGLALNVSAIRRRYRGVAEASYRRGYADHNFDLAAGLTGAGL